MIIIGPLVSFVGIVVVDFFVFGILQFIFGWSSGLTNFLIFAPATIVAILIFIGELDNLIGCIKYPELHKTPYKSDLPQNCNDSNCGRRTGSTVSKYGNNYDHKDIYGYRTGSTVNTYGNNYEHKDIYGYCTGSTVNTYGNNYEHKDIYGKTTGKSVVSDDGGTIEHYDIYNRKTGYSKVNSYGDITEYDIYGKEVSRSSK